jgi:hypothetical protein
VVTTIPVESLTVEMPVSVGPEGAISAPSSPRRMTTARAILAVDAKPRL